MSTQFGAEALTDKHQTFPEFILVAQVLIGNTTQSGHLINLMLMPCVVEQYIAVFQLIFI